MTSSIDSDLGDISNLNDVQPFCNIADDANNLGFDKNHLCCASVNLNSILHGDRLSQIESILKCNNLGVLAVQESKLNNTKHPSTYHIENYSVIAKHRPTGGRGGGLLLYLRNDIPFRRLTNLESNSPTLEHICCEIFIQNKRIIVNCAYRPPSCDQASFIQNLATTIDGIRQSKAWMTVWLSDLNFGNNYDFYNNLTTKSIDHLSAAVFEENCLVEVIDVPTRYQKESVSLIDTIFVDRFDKVCKASVFPAIADHCGTSVSFDIFCKQPEQRIQEKYQFEKMTNQMWLEFKTYLLQFKTTDSWDSNQHTEALTTYLVEGIKKFVPKVSLKQKTFDIPWNSALIRRLLRKKSRLYKCYRKVSDQFHLLRPDDPNYIFMKIRVANKYSSFQKSSKEYKNESRRAKNEYYNSLSNVWKNPKISAKKKFSLLQKLSRTSKSNVIPPIIENGKIVNDPLQKANIFNEHFTGKSNVINPNDKPPTLDAFTTNEAFENLDTSHFEIGQLIKSLKSSNFSPCGIPANFLKMAYSHTGSIITKLISDLLNRIFHTGVYPHMWTLAHITPIFKAKDKSDKANYRPISILATLSKITESVIHKHLLRHLISNNLISKHQSAYIPKDSTSQQLITMLHHIKYAMSSNKVAHGVFLDVSSAFDAVWTSGLLSKLSQLNIKGTVFDLFSSYLHDRRAVTVVDGHKSSELPLNAGVPQGSRLGPLLFLIYVNDLVNDLESMPFLYADDTTLIATANSTFETTNILNRDLHKISLWAHNWKLNFNPQKSCDMVFGRAQYNLHHPTIMGLHVIQRVHLHKHLGVFITSDLSWQKQIQSIIQKVNLKLSILWQVNGLSRSCLDVLCKSHVRSSIDYCLTVFGPQLNQMQIKQLDNLLYKAAKLVVGAQKYTSQVNLFNEIGWEDTSKRIEYLSLTQFHKIMHRDTTPLIQECLPPLLSSRYPTKRTFEHYPNNMSFFQKSYFPYVIKKWDALEMKDRSLDHIEFKSKLKENYKPFIPKHFKCGFKLGSRLHAQLRLKRSYLNCHLHPIGLSITPACKCGEPTETVKHFLIECKQYHHEREQMFSKLNGLLEQPVSKYTKANLCDILLHGEKPEIKDKYMHNKHIFFCVQRFICKTKRMYFNEENKPSNHVQAVPQLNNADSTASHNA